MSEQFTPVRAFRELLAEFSIEQEDNAPGDGWQLYLRHDPCTAWVCQVEDADSIDVLVQTVIEHECE